MLKNPLGLNIQDTFNKELPADQDRSNTRRQVREACYSFVTPRVASNPRLLHYSPEMLSAIGLEKVDAKDPYFTQVFSGNTVLLETDPYAMCYGGHQFGNWAGQLGDGRAINLAEVVVDHKRWALQLKGSGETPYSRTADGLAVLRSSIREYLCSEAMFHLGVPTTRALSLMLSGDKVLRDMMYDGNSAFEKGAIVCRLAPSFIRFGNFEIFAARKDKATLQRLVDYTIKYFYPELGKPSKETYIAFFQEVANRTMEMIVHWQRVGFVHGVMNTDNFSILGLTIDYGPYGWLEGYDHGWTPNTTDRQHKRYRFGQQGSISMWNLFQLGNAIFPLVGEAAPLENILNNYQSKFEEAYFQMMKSKLGLLEEDEEDGNLIDLLHQVLHLTETDMTIFYRNLSDYKKGEEVEDRDLLNPIHDAFYAPQEVNGEMEMAWKNWIQKYLARLKKETLSDTARKAKMDTINPKYVLRNYMAQLAIDDADQGKYDLIDELFQLLRQPYAEQPEFQKWFARRPEWARHKVGCSMLSCSS